MSIPRQGHLLFAPGFPGPILLNNNYPAISQELRERVMRVVREYNFVPNVTARGLAGGKTRLVGVLTPLFCLARRWMSLWRIFTARPERASACCGRCWPADAPFV